MTTVSLWIEGECYASGIPLDYFLEFLTWREEKDGEK